MANVQCYGLVNNAYDKVIAFTKGLLVEGFMLGIGWALLMGDPHDLFTRDLRPFLLLVCVFVLVPGPMVLIDALTMRICITDRGISRASALKRPGEPWIRWEQVVGVDVQSNPMCVSRIKRVVVCGRHEVHGIGGAYWITRKVDIPGHLPDIQRILASLREHAGDSFVGQADASG